MGLLISRSEIVTAMEVLNIQLEIFHKLICIKTRCIYKNWYPLLLDVPVHSFYFALHIATGKNLFWSFVTLIRIDGALKPYSAGARVHLKKLRTLGIWVKTYRELWASRRYSEVIDENCPLVAVGLQQINVMESFNRRDETFMAILKWTFHLLS